MQQFDASGIAKVTGVGGGGGGITNINVSAGTTSNNLSNLVFSNSNSVSFGLNGSTITASVNAGLTNVNISAGTTSNNLSNFVFSNSNNVSFGLGGSTITATATVGSTQGSINISAGTTSNLSSNFIFSNSNNVSFGIAGNTITATVTATVASTQGSIRISAGTTSVLSSAFTFSNSNNFSFGIDNGTITASYTVPTVTNSSWSISDALTSGTVARLAFTNLNGITLSLSTGAGGSHTIVGSHNAITSQTNQTLSFVATSNTTQNTTLTVDARSLTFNGAGDISVGFSNGSIVLSNPVINLSLWANNLPAQTTTGAFNNGQLQVFPLVPIINYFPGKMTVSTMWLAISGTMSSGAAFTRSLSIGFYTLVSNLSQLSLAFSASTSWGTNAANAAMSQSFAGIRWVTFHSSQFNNTPSFSETQYWLGWWERSSSGSQTFGPVGYVTNDVGNRSGFMSVLVDAPAVSKWYPFFGFINNSFSTAMPTVLNSTSLADNGTTMSLMPTIMFNNISNRIV